MRISVILSTYNRPAVLELSLWGFAVQTTRDFQIVIADDGSGPETAALIDRMRRETGMELVHVWHPDRGFRKTEILNRAILAAGGDYLIFSDGDCIPRGDFVAAHARRAAPRCYSAGNYLTLPAAVSDVITADDVRRGRVAEPAWLRNKGWRGGRRRLRLVRSPWMAAILDAVTARPFWRGNNSATWKALCLRVNGFDMDMGYGSEDWAFGERLRNLGVRPRIILYRAPTLHLDHARPYVDEEIRRYNRSVLERIRRNREVRARFGIAELESGVVPPRPGRA